MEEQNVDDDRAEERQPERDKPSHQAEQAADNLQRSHDIKVMADEQRLGKIAGRAAWRRGHVKELQETRDRGVAAADTVAREYLKDAPERQALGARYLRDNIKYDLGDDERAGLNLFYRYVSELGLAPPGTLRFYGQA